MLETVRSGQRVKGSGQPQWRELGQRLAHTLRQSNGASSTSARLQGLVADLAAEHTALLLPLKDLVTRPAFQALVPRAGSGTGAVQRDVLLQELEATYALPVIAAIAELLDGFLDLPPGSLEQMGAAATDLVQSTPAPGLDVRTSATDQRTAPPPPAWTPPPFQPQPPPPPAPVWPAAPAPLAQPPERGMSGCSLVLLGLVTALVVAGGVVVLRSTDLCALVGLCPGVQVAGGVRQALQAAEQAEQDLRQANDLRAYERALIELERHLLVLASATLTSEQEQRRQRLDQVARDARGVLADETSDARRLEKVARALASARESSGEQRASLMAMASQELEAIGPRSFSAPEAKRLRQQLEQLEREALVSEPPPLEVPSEEPPPVQDLAPSPPITPFPPISPPPPVPTEEPAP
jgi:hypothetical protein